MQSGRQRLRAWITRSKINQNEAADLLSMNPVMLSQVLNGQRKPGLGTAITIEQVTGISVESWVLSKVSGASEDDTADSSKRQIAKG